MNHADLAPISSTARMGANVVSYERLRPLGESAPPSLGVGTVLGGKFELLRWLDSGGMGEVWLARHLGLDEPVAIKILFSSPDPHDGGGSAARFHQEACIAARLSTRTAHVVRVTDYGLHGDRPYLAMELLEGETLESEMRRGHLCPSRVAEIIRQVARALELAHADGILHRDIKPANVFLTRDEDGGLLVKLLDFGIARIPRKNPDDPRATAAGLTLGTPAYMSPEQVAGPSDVDRRCDLWALAATAYEALTGKLVVRGRDAREMLRNLLGPWGFASRAECPALPEALAAFFDRAFAKRIEDRFESASGMAVSFLDAVTRTEEQHVGAALLPTRVAPVPATVHMLAHVARAGVPRRAGRTVALFVSMAVVTVLAGCLLCRPTRADSRAASPPHRALAPHAPRALARTQVVLPEEAPPPAVRPPVRFVDRSAVF